MACVWGKSREMCVGGYKDVLTGYDYQNVRGSWSQWQVYAMSAIVTFGNRNFIKDKARQRERIGREMEKFNDVLEGGCGGPAEGEEPVATLSIEEAEAALGAAIKKPLSFKTAAFFTILENKIIYGDGMPILP